MMTKPPRELRSFMTRSMPASGTLSLIGEATLNKRLQTLTMSQDALNDLGNPLSSDAAPVRRSVWLGAATALDIGNHFKLCHRCCTYIIRLSAADGPPILPALFSFLDVSCEHDRPSATRAPASYPPT